MVVIQIPTVIQTQFFTGVPLGFVQIENSKSRINTTGQIYESGDENRLDLMNIYRIPLKSKDSI